jgi:hypothetical protein
MPRRLEAIWRRTEFLRVTQTSRVRTRIDRFVCQVPAWCLSVFPQNHVQWPNPTPSPEHRPCHSTSRGRLPDLAIVRRTVGGRELPARFHTCAEQPALQGPHCTETGGSPERQPSASERRPDFPPRSERRDSKCRAGDREGRVDYAVRVSQKPLLGITPTRIPPPERILPRPAPEGAAAAEVGVLVGLEEGAEVGAPDAPLPRAWCGVLRRRHSRVLGRCATW